MGSAYGGLSDAVAPPENILAALVFRLQGATPLRKVNLGKETKRSRK
jgi:hypothetical protein